MTGTIVPPWLEVRRGEAPLVLSLPHTGTEIPEEIERRLISPWLARQDADWWIDQLYGFAADLGATVVRTAVSRTVIDVNRDPTGASLYPGAATTELCPTTTFDGAALYKPGGAPDASEIARRRDLWLTPYHQALRTEIGRLREAHPVVVVYDAHSIRSHVPRLFEGRLPQFNIGANCGAACAAELTRAVEAVCDTTGLNRVTDGRFRGGWITRALGEPRAGVHAIQMELACRGYMDEPELPLRPETWPSSYDAARAQPMSETLSRVLRACLAFATSAGDQP